MDRRDQWVQWTRHREQLFRSPRPDEEKRIVDKLTYIILPILQQLPREIQCQLPSGGLSLLHYNRIVHALQDLFGQGPIETENSCPICATYCNSTVTLYCGYCKKVGEYRRKALHSWLCPPCRYRILRFGSGVFSLLTGTHAPTFSGINEALQSYEAFEQIFLAERRNEFIFWVRIIKKSFESHIIQHYCKCE